MRHPGQIPQQQDLFSVAVPAPGNKHDGMATGEKHQLISAAQLPLLRSRDVFVSSLKHEQNLTKLQSG